MNCNKDGEQCKTCKHSHKMQRDDFLERMRDCGISVCIPSESCGDIYECDRHFVHTVDGVCQEYEANGN